MPAEGVFDGVLILCSDILRLTYGFVADLMGFMGLIPFTRVLLKRCLSKKTRNMTSEGRVVRLRPFR